MALYDLKDKYVLITGASSGIGLELAKVFAAYGSHLALGCLPNEETALMELKNELEQNHGIRVWPFPLDLAEPGAPKALYDKVTASLPQVDVLVNNAGIMLYGEFHEKAMEQHLRVLKVNAEVYTALMSLFLPDMVARKNGRVLNVSSAAAFQPTCHHAVYGATKAYVQSLSEALDAEVRGYGVRVQTVNPSYTATPLLEHDFPKRLWWFSVSGLSDPADIAQKAVDAFVRNKAVFLPGWKNFLVASFLPRLTPRRLASILSFQVLKIRKG
jgi:short-subunit dehydrogenase